MTLTLRKTKGEALTYSELDDNFVYLDGRIDDLGDVEIALAKLNGIEEFATADQTPSEIKTAYESNANTNAFSDEYKQKLDYITITGPFNADEESNDSVPYLNVFTANGTATDFTLDVVPASNAHITVYIDGVYQNYSVYEFSNTTLSFSSPPEENSVIEIRTLPKLNELSAIDQVFTVAQRTKVDFLSVTNNIDLDELGDLNHDFQIDYITARDS